MGNEQQNEGNLEQARGSVKEKVGDWTDNEKMENEGKFDQGKGKLREGVGDVRDALEDDRPR